MRQKQQRFVAEYLTTGNATQAAIAAGYSASGAAVQGSRLLDTPEVQQAISEQQQVMMDHAAITLDSILAELEQARQTAIELRQPAAAINATMHKARLLGLDNPEARAKAEQRKQNDLIFKIPDLI